jgi:hypothetical protein
MNRLAIKGTAMKIVSKFTCIGALALFAALAGHTSVLAQIDSKIAPAAKKAAAEFAERGKGSEKTGEVPRLSDPATKRLLDTIFDSRDVQAAKSIPFSTLTQLSDRMLAGTKAGLIYMLAGTGITDMNQIGTVPDAETKINLNVIKYPAEMGNYFDFAVTMQGAIAESVQNHMNTSKPAEQARPNFQSGLANIRSGATGSVSGVIETIAVNGITDEWIRARLTALAAVAPKLSKFLLPEQKEQLSKLANACADVTNDAVSKKGLQDFAFAIAAR